MKRPNPLLCAAAGTLLLAGCAPPPERGDPVAETMRMIKEARRTGKTGRSNNVFVRLEKVTATKVQASGLGSLWSYTTGRLTVSGGDRLAAGGVRVRAAGGKFDAQLSAWARRAGNVSRTAEEIAVLAGQRGYLWVGRRTLVPLLRVATPSGEAVVLRGEAVGARLEVVPRILTDGRIELELTPSFAVLGGPHRGQSCPVATMTTRVVVKPGRKLVLGASSSAREGSAALGLFGYDSLGKESVTLITVSAERL